MMGVIGLIAFFSVLGLSLIITRMATVALTLTGLSEQAARFQARSAFTGTGFTTREAEAVVNHSVRRSIVMFLMIVRSAGLVTILISIMLSFAGEGDANARGMRLIWLLGGVGVLWLLASNRWLDRWTSALLSGLLSRYTTLDIRDYAKLLNLANGYGVTDLDIQEDSWLDGRRIRTCALRQEGVEVLGIVRENGDYVGVPQPETEIEAGDRLIVYGRKDALRELSGRKTGASGERSHEEAVGEHDREVARQEVQEAERRRGSRNGSAWRSGESRKKGDDSDA